MIDTAPVSFHPPCELHRRAGWRRLAVEMHDANTLDLVAPEKVVTNFYGGKYLVYTYNKSAKFRIDHVRGDNAVLSGIFFDPAP